LEAGVQFLVALLLAGVTAWVISIIGAGAVERAISAFAQLVGGWRPDPWPRGVQEEDRDRPWGELARRLARDSHASVDDGQMAVPAQPIRPRTTAR
jgi:hypothetical protein